MLLDSNVLIACLAGDDAAKRLVVTGREQHLSLFISVISVAELTSFPSLTEADLARITLFVDEFLLLQIDKGIAEVAGQLRRTYRLSLPDALIGATAFARRLPLVTRDKKLLKLKEITVRTV